MAADTADRPTTDDAAALHCSSGQRQQRSERIPICLYGTAAPLLSSPFATDGRRVHRRRAASIDGLAAAAPRSVRPSPSQRRHAPPPPRPRRRRAGDTRRVARSVMASPSTRVASAARRSVRARACAVSPIATVLFCRRGGRADRLSLGRGCLKSRSLARSLAAGVAGTDHRPTDRPSDRQKERERGWRTNKRADFPLPSFLLFPFDVFLRPRQ